MTTPLVNIVVRILGCCRNKGSVSTFSPTLLAAFKKGDTMSTQPRDWSALGKRLEKWTPPKGAFDPAAAWSLRYVRHALIPLPDGGGPSGAAAGSLSITLKPTGDALALSATESVQAGFTLMTTEADISCLKDTLLTPQRWSLRVSWQAGAPATVRPGELDQARSGHVDGKMIVFKGVREHPRPAPERWTTLWNLFAVVPRLAFDAASVLTFDLFEELELHKPGQRVAYIGPQAVTLNGQTLDLHVFEQTGHGMLPWRWWLDDQHRVLLAAGGRRAYLLAASGQGGAA